MNSVILMFYIYLCVLRITVSECVCEDLNLASCLSVSVADLGKYFSTIYFAMINKCLSPVFGCEDLWSWLTGEPQTSHQSSLRLLFPSAAQGGLQ